MNLEYKTERKAVSVLVDYILSHPEPKDRRKALTRLSYVLQEFFGAFFAPQSFEDARRLIDENHKWTAFLDRALATLHPNVLKTSIMNLGFESGFYGLKVRERAKKKYHCNIPWAILVDPTSACNLHCTGCWAAEYGHTVSLSYEQLDALITEAKALGIHFFLLTGGEPLTRKQDVVALCRKHHDCEFHAFTNGTLVDEAFCKDLQEIGNLSLSLSLEGFRDVNNSRRGPGVFDKVMHAMDLLREHGIVFGTSICYTSKNIESVTSDAFLDLIISKGAWYTWYFHYMPVGNDASPDLLPTAEQRAYMVKRVREIRSAEGGKPIFAMDFQNDGRSVGGCVAGGRNYCHINPNGDVEPCVFIHYSSANIKDKPFVECLQQPLFKEYAKGQPFNGNQLRPCPMLENPALLRDMVRRSGAHSTDLTSPETVDHLCDKCVAYAKAWQPVASRLWKQEKGECSQGQNAQ